MSEENQEEIEFWRYADGIRDSAIVGVVEQFSTREPGCVTLARVFRILGTELSYLVRADEAYHLFLNPAYSESHILRCDSPADYVQQEMRIQLSLHKEDPLSWFYFRNVSPLVIDAEYSEVRPGSEIETLWTLLEEPAFLAIAPFCQRDIPLGYFVFVWRDPVELPALFRKKGSVIRESAGTTLNFLQSLVTRLVTNHFTLYRDTYLPSFMQPMARKVAILFADIRNFTSVFAAMRSLNYQQGASPNALVGLLKAYLSAASQVIAQPGIGRIDKFIGDGIMATFGEHLVCREEGDANRVSCLLALYSGAMLIDAFKKLFAHFLEVDSVRSFLMESNERLDLRIGVGINFGEATFDYFGTSMIDEDDSFNLIGGYLEFTAIGDNVNIAQRLESIASKPANEVNIDRSRNRSERSPDRLAPIMVGRPTFLRIEDSLRKPFERTGESLADHYRSFAALKGRTGAAEVYEIYPDEISGDYILRTMASLNLNSLEFSMSQYWNAAKSVFEFPDQRAKELITRYC